MLTHFRFEAVGFLGILVLGIWLHLFFGRGWFWRLKNADADRQPAEPPNDWPAIVAVVPARNEAETIARAVTSLVHQNYPGKFSIVLVDDRSEDATQSIAKRVARESGAENRLRIVTAPELPPGWTGKLWALQTGVSAATESLEGALDYFWFTDADVTHAPDALARLVSRAERAALDLASLMVLLHAETLPEGALIPAFLYFFLMLYPPKWIADDDLKLAGAAGGCILLKRQSLERIGGLAAIRGEVIDDCALARAVKRSRGRVWLGLTRRSASLRAYGSFAEIRDLIARTAFTQLKYSALLLLGTVLGMLLTFVAPVVLILAHDAIARTLGAASGILMTASLWPTLRFYRLSLWWALLLPLAALFYTYATWLSAARYWTGRGGQWKGRAQAQRGA
jgi:hopene-associated glycosyltransferase HpnB